MLKEVWPEPDTNLLAMVDVLSPAGNSSLRGFRQKLTEIYVRFEIQKKNENLYNIQ